MIWVVIRFSDRVCILVCAQDQQLDFFPVGSCFLHFFGVFGFWGGVGEGKLLGVKFQLYWVNWAWILGASSLELFCHFNP